MEISDIKIIGTRGNPGADLHPASPEQRHLRRLQDPFRQRLRFVHTADEIIEHVKQGFSVRMSTGNVAPSLICAKRVMAENPALFA